MTLVSMGAGKEVASLARQPANKTSRGLDAWSSKSKNVEICGFQ